MFNLYNHHIIMTRKYVAESSIVSYTKPGFILHSYQNREKSKTNTRITFFSLVENLVCYNTISSDFLHFPKKEGRIDPITYMASAGPLKSSDGFL